jgi:integrase
MPKFSKNPYLKRDYNTWIFRFPWPKDVQQYVGQTEFIKSTQTKNLHEAEFQRDVWLAECKKSVHVLRTGGEASRHEELLHFRRRWAEAPVVVDDEYEEHHLTDEEDLEEEIFARAVELNLKGGMAALLEEYKKEPAAPSYDYALKRLGAYKRVHDYIRLATNQETVSTSLTQYLMEWVNWRKNDVVLKTVDDGKAVVLKFAKEFPTVDHVDVHNVGRWFEKLRVGDSKTGTGKLGTARRKKIKGHLVSYWRFLQRNLATPIVPRDVDPFIEIVFPSKKHQKINPEETWKHFPNLADDAVMWMNVWQERGDKYKEKGRTKNFRDATDLWTLMFISMYTGMRPEEIALAKKADVKITLEKDVINGAYIHVPREQTKTDAGVRDIPIHTDLHNLMYYLVKDQDKKNPFLIEGLISNNKYGIRSDPVLKRFSYLKEKMGYGSEVVLYSFRKTVITMLQQADVSSDIIPYLVGHEPESFSLRAYGGGPTYLQKISALHNLKYPDFNYDWFRYWNSAPAEPVDQEIARIMEIPVDQLTPEQQMKIHGIDPAR